MHEKTAVFNLFTRKNPFNGNYTIACGIDDALSFIDDFAFSKEDIYFLKQVSGSDNKPVFHRDFLDYLKDFTPRVKIYGVVNGTLFFPFEPILRVEGSLLACQLLETPLLNIINFQSLIATKACRIKESARKKPVIDFGLRRAQGFDGALSATKAAFIGGIDATSNIMAAKEFGIPMRGTHAHSFVMAHEKEEDAFKNYAASFPHECVFLLDTYDTKGAIEKAIKIFHKMSSKGQKPLGVRLDSGDLLTLSSYVRNKLNQAGLHVVKIIASGDLDEYQIEKLLQMKAPIDIFGVGTRLITGFDEPALGGVYKLAAIKCRNGFRYTAKSSDSRIKRSLLGPKTFFRLFDHGRAQADVVCHPAVDPESLIKPYPASRQIKPMHRLLFDAGKKLLQPLKPSEIRRQVKENLKTLPPAFKKLEPLQKGFPIYFEPSDHTFDINNILAEATQCLGCEWH